MPMTHRKNRPPRLCGFDSRVGRARIRANVGTASDTLTLLCSEDQVRALSQVPDAGARLRQLVTQGAAAFPLISVPDRAWAEHFGRHVSPDDVDAFLAEFCAEDVHLVLGTLGGQPRALTTFDARLVAVAPRALRGIRLVTMSSDELMQHVREKLLVGSDRKLSSYSGRGALDGWLRVVMARAAISMCRVHTKTETAAEDADAMLQVASTDSAAIEALRQAHAPIFREAITEAIESLDADDRALLRLHYVDGLTIDDLAFIYHVHRATTARRVARLRSAILDKTRTFVQARLGLQENEFHSVMGAILSRIDVTIARLIGGAP